jgi:signal transduction histidine kinase
VNPIVRARDFSYSYSAERYSYSYSNGPEWARASQLALIGELTSSIAHEINQPLGAILSSADAAEMLLDSSPAPLDGVRRILVDIRKDDIRANDVIRHIRTLLQNRVPESGHLTPGRQYCGGARSCHWAHFSKKVHVIRTTRD